MHGTKGNGFHQAMEFCRIQKVVDEHLGTVDLYFPTISYKKLSFMNFSVVAVITYLKSSES